MTSEKAYECGDNTMASWLSNSPASMIREDLHVDDCTIL